VAGIVPARVNTVNFNGNAHQSISQDGAVGMTFLPASPIALKLSFDSSRRPGQVDRQAQQRAAYPEKQGFESCSSDNTISFHVKQPGSQRLGG